MSATLSPVAGAVPQTRTPRRFPRILLAVLALWLLSGTYLIQPDQQAVVTRFGAVTEPRVPPGLHYALPWPVDRVF